MQQAWRQSVYQQRGCRCSINTLSEEFVSGMRAFKAGLSITACPLDNSVERDAWKRGWHEASYSSMLFSTSSSNRSTSSLATLGERSTSSAAVS